MSALHATLAILGTVYVASVVTILTWLARGGARHAPVHEADASQLDALDGLTSRIIAGTDAALNNNSEGR